MFAQSALFETENVWMICNGVNYTYRDDLAPWVFVFQCAAGSIFMMQHALFVGQYMRVAVTIPLTFCSQSDDVKRKLHSRLCYVLFAELICAAYLTFQFCY